LGACVVHRPPQVSPAPAAEESAAKDNLEARFLAARELEQAGRPEDAFAALYALGTDRSSGGWAIAAARESAGVAGRAVEAEAVVSCPPGRVAAGLSTHAPCPGAARPLSAWERRELDAIDLLMTLAGGPDVPWALYERGLVLFNAGDYDAANDSFAVILRICPQCPQAGDAARRVLDSYARANDWVGLEGAAWTYCNDSALGTPALRAEFLTIHDEAMKHINE
jgi:tetratricopeptide (TPR) repeat protein